MRVKRKQLKLIIEDLLLEQEEDSGYIKQKVKEELNKPEYQMAGETAKNLKDAGIKVVTGHPIEGLKNFSKKEDESLKKIISDADAEDRAHIAGVAVKGSRSLGSLMTPAAAGEVGIISLLVDGSFAAAAAAVAVGAAESAAVAAAVASLYSAAEAFGAGLDANTALVKKYKREIMTKLFTIAIARARSEGIVEQNLKKRAFSQMLSIVEGRLPTSGRRIADLAVIFSFLTQEDAQKIADDMWNKFLDSTDATGSGVQLSLFFDVASVYIKIFKPKFGVFAQAVRIINNSKKMTAVLSNEIIQNTTRVMGPG